MAFYRLYFFRSQTGRIREVREFEAPHDFAAIQAVAKWRSGEAMELWSGTRKVTRWADRETGAEGCDWSPSRLRAPTSGGR
jgi:hypothetical protein